MKKKKWYLGKLKGTAEPVYLEDFRWECDWYWGGGYIGNKQFHAHFDGAFLDTVDSRGHPLNSRYTFLDPWQPIPHHLTKENVLRISNGASVWEHLSFFLDDPQYGPNQWWRLKDLFTQFYRLKAAAEVFLHGGHCSLTGRHEAEINKDMADRLNTHIETVIIAEIRKALNNS